MNILNFLEWLWIYSIFGRNSRILKLLTNEISEEIQKRINIFNFNGVIKRGIHHLFLSINVMKKFKWWWKFSIFGRNSPILKVLTHEISYEIPKKLKFSILMVSLRELFIICFAVKTS